MPNSIVKNKENKKKLLKKLYPIIKCTYDRKQGYALSIYNIINILDLLHVNRLI